VPASYGPDSPILVVGGISPAELVAPEAIRGALRERRSTDRGSDFLGRRTTEVWADERTVLKIRPELELPHRLSEGGDERVRWIEARLERERRIGVYASDRTWFLIGEGDGVAAGVATRRRRPLHLWPDEELAAHWAWYAHEFGERYLTAGEHGWRLDEGLSNFAADGAPGTPLVYLDDDLYVWDRGETLRMFWTVLGRSNRALGAEHGAILGVAFRQALDRRLPMFETRSVADDLRTAARGNEFLMALAAALVAPKPKPARRERRRDARTIALLADVHANLDALDAVLTADEVAAADEVLVLGDSVGYGPDPAAVLARLRADPRIRVLKGNHDQAMVDPVVAARFTKDAWWSAEWTREHLAPDDLAWLAALPLELGGEEWLAVHGAPADPQRFNQYVYRFSADDNLERLELDGVPLCFYGNTHVAGAWARVRKRADGEFVKPDAPLELARYRTLLVCPGSVGQPRDAMPGAAYAMYDRAARTIRWERVPYDVRPVQARMRANAFPPRLVDRLDEGA